MGTTEYVGRESRDPQPREAPFSENRFPAGQPPEGLQIPIESALDDFLRQLRWL